MTTEDTRIVLRTGEMNDPIVEHPEQPAEYRQTDGPDIRVWTWQESWRMVGGVHLRVYDLEVRIVLRGRQIGLADDPIVDHPEQPADYVHTDGTVWTWLQRWRPVPGIPDDKRRTFGRTLLRAYDLVTSDTDG